MKFVSIGIETTGLDPETCQILQIGAVIEDTVKILPLIDLPKFSCIIEHPIYTGQPYALNLNNWIMQILASLQTAKTSEERSNIRKANHIMPHGLAARALYEWLKGNGIEPTVDSKETPAPGFGGFGERMAKLKTGQIQINVAGKNFGTFDKLFLEKLPSWSSFIQINQRIIDPTVIFTDWLNDERLPNLDTCMSRINISDKVTHDAVQDALDVIRVIREVTNLYENNLYK